MRGFQKENLKSARKFLNYTYKSLSEAAGISISNLKSIESGKTINPNQTTIDKLTRVFGTAFTGFPGYLYRAFESDAARMRYLISLHIPPKGDTRRGVLALAEGAADYRVSGEFSGARIDLTISDEAARWLNSEEGMHFVFGEMLKDGTVERWVNSADGFTAVAEEFAEVKRRSARKGNDK